MILPCRWSIGVFFLVFSFTPNPPPYHIPHPLYPNPSHVPACACVSCCRRGKKGLCTHIVEGALKDREDELYQTATTLNPSSHRTAPTRKVTGTIKLNVALFGVSLTPIISPQSVGVKQDKGICHPNAPVEWQTGPVCLLPSSCHPALTAG